MPQLLADKFDYEIQYNSIYDDQWKIMAFTVVPEKM